MNRVPNLPPLGRDELSAADPCLAAVPMGHADGRLVLVPITPPAPVRYVLAEGTWTPAPTNGPFHYDPYGQHPSHAANSASNAESEFAWHHLHQAGQVNDVSSDVHFRLRDFHPDLGRWKTQEPVAYVEGLNLFEYPTAPEA